MAVLFALGACSRAPADAPAAREDASAKRFEDAHFIFSYPAAFSASGTNPEADPSFAPNFSLQGPTSESGMDPSLLLTPDPFHPDMLRPDAAKALAESSRRNGDAILGGIRRFPTKNGACVGFLANSLMAECPERAPASTSGKCHSSTLSAFCESPSGKKYFAIGQLDWSTSLNQLTPQAAAAARTFETVLSTLEFKQPAKDVHRGY